MKIAIYARVSTEKQEKQETINSQLDALRDYAQKNNYTIYEEYIDEGYSGELLDRPELDKLRDDAKNKLFDVILVHSPDRLSRKFIYLGLLQEEFKKYGVNIIFLNRPDSKDTPEDNLFNGVQGLIAEFEKAKILERTRRGKLHKAKSNMLVGSIPPYGYKYIKGNKATNTIGHYEVEEQEAKVVRLIFNLFVNKHLSIRTIARELTKRGIKPRRGKHWRTSSLHRIIRNETYTGVTYYNKNISVETDNRKSENKYRRAKNTGRLLRPKDQWIPINLPQDIRIIDKKTFDLAQKQLKRNSELSPRNVKYKYLLRGLVKCGSCDSPYQGTPCHGKLFYRCGNKNRTFPLPKECNASMIKAESLESVVWNKFCEAIRNPYLITKQIERVKNKVLKSKNSIERDIKSIDGEITNADNEENRLLDAYRENIISMDQLKDQMSKIQAKKKQLENDKQDLIVKQDTDLSSSLSSKTIEDYCDTIRRRLETIQDDFEAKRYLLSLAVNTILLEGNVVRIKGVIPTHTQETPVLSSIESISSVRCGHLQQRLQKTFLCVPDL